jgi:linoleoyl-CoA desaturase
LQKITFNNKNNQFFKTLKDKVDLYFLTQKKAPTGNMSLYFKSGLQVATAILLYVLLVFVQPNIVVSIILCGLLGANLGFIGFNIMHEGGHQSFSDIKWVNRVSAYFLNVMGGNALYWKVKHNINHHTYTNIEGMDEDINIEPFMRLHTTHRKYWIHRFQHIYWVFLYGITYISWIFVTDFTKYFSGRIGPISQKWTFNEHLIFWITKVSYVVLFIGLPAYFVGILPTLIGFVIMAFVCGHTIGIVFQMAHIVEHTAFPLPESDSTKIEKEWAIHQVETTANFGTKNKTLSWFLGGLNFQVEHHLFPRVSHVHYPAINTIVKETCSEFNVRYLEYPSMLSAFWSHLKHLKKMGVAT